MKKKQQEYFVFAENDEYDKIFHKNLSAKFMDRHIKKPYLIIEDKTIDDNFLNNLITYDDGKLLEEKYCNVKDAHLRWTVIFEKIICLVHTIFINCKFENINDINLRFCQFCVFIRCKFNNCKINSLLFDQCIIDRLNFNSVQIKDGLTFGILYDTSKAKSRRKWHFSDTLFIKDICFNKCSIGYMTTDLMYANDTILRDLNNYVLTNVLNMLSKIPSKGEEMYGYKVVHDHFPPYDYWSNSNLYILKILIPKNANRMINLERICRATEAIPIKVYNIYGKEFKSEKYSNKIFYPLYHVDGVQYKLNKMSKTLSGFNCYVCESCGAGINFFLTKREAMEFINRGLV